MNEKFNSNLAVSVGLVAILTKFGLQWATMDDYQTFVEGYMAV